MSDAVLYATTPGGESLPIIDVTHPAFVVRATEAELAAMSEQYLLESAQRGEIPAAMREALRGSKFGRALMEASGSYLPGMITYQLKLGPDNLGADASQIDRRIAASFPAFATRLRLQDMAFLLADGLARICDEEWKIGERRRPIRLINIGGGAASDSWNALVCLRARGAELLTGREIAIAVLDIQEDGPTFGASAIEALCAPGAPLGGLEIAWRHVPFEWSQVSRLPQILEDLGAAQAVCAVSSEGGLFEYGSDEEIVSNLAAIDAGTAPDAMVVGSVTRDGELARASQGATGIRTRLRTLEGFGALAAEAGWAVQQAIERPFSYNVRLVKV